MAIEFHNRDDLDRIGTKTDLQSRRTATPSFSKTALISWDSEPSYRSSPRRAEEPSIGITKQVMAEIQPHSRFLWELCLLVITFLIGILAFGPQAAYAENQSRNVLDNAGVLSSDTESFIESVNGNLKEIDGSKPQLAVITIPELKGTGYSTIEEAAQGYFDKYGFGHKGKDDGVLLLISVKDRKVRLQTGYGMEGILPDTTINEIMTKDVKGKLKANDYDSAVRSMVNEIETRINGGEISGSSKPKSVGDWTIKIIQLIPLIVLVIPAVWLLVSIVWDLIMLVWEFFEWLALKLLSFVAPNARLTQWLQNKRDQNILWRSSHSIRAPIIYDSSSSSNRSSRSGGSSSFGGRGGSSGGGGGTSSW